MFHVEDLGLTFFPLTNSVAKKNFALKYRFTQWVNVFAGIQTQIRQMRGQVTFYLLF